MFAFEKKVFKQINNNEITAHFRPNQPINWKQLVTRGLVYGGLLFTGYHGFLQAQSHNTENTQGGGTFIFRGSKN
jgi:hypothetical protein